MVSGLEIVIAYTPYMLTKEELAGILDTDDFFNFDQSDGVYILFGSLRNKEKEYFDDNDIRHEYDEIEHYTIIDTTYLIRTEESRPY